MKRAHLILLLLACGVHAFPQQSPYSPIAGQILVVVPFENESKVPGIDWISESFPEVLGQRMAIPPYYVLDRETRLYAYDRLGIPTTQHPSRATLIRIADSMDADFVILGGYSFDGRTFSARAQILDMKHLRVSPESVESGPITDIMRIENALAWDLLHTMDAHLTQSRNGFVAAAIPVRLDAFENHIRGILAGSRQQKIKYFREAVRLMPDYSEVILQLGKAYYEGREYEAAATWMARMPKTAAGAAEANFYLGLAAHYTGNYRRAKEAFEFVASRLPLPEVLNNLGVAIARQGKSATVYFQRAVQADGRDPDYRFNLALSLARSGDLANAAAQLREVLALRPRDAEAQNVLSSVLAGKPLPTATPTGDGGSPAQPVPLERIKRNYDESSYRQLALEIQNVQELRHRNLTPIEHARTHLSQGLEFLSGGNYGQAENEFRRAILLDPTLADAHAGLAEILLSRENIADARAEAATTNLLQPSAAAFLVLARLDLRDNNLEAALEHARQALRLDPGNTKANELHREIAARLAEKAQRAHEP